MLKESRKHTCQTATLDYIHSAQQSEINTQPHLPGSRVRGREILCIINKHPKPTLNYNYMSHNDNASVNDRLHIG